MHHRSYETSETSVNFCHTTRRNIPENTFVSYYPVAFNTFQPGEAKKRVQIPPRVM
jgi:hypothetical protein